MRKVPTSTNSSVGDGGVVALCEGPGCPSNWWMFGYAGAHTGYNTAERGAAVLPEELGQEHLQTLGLNPACAEDGRAFVTYNASGAPADPFPRLT